MVQLSHPYMTTGKTITLTRWTFLGKVMSLLFNMLSRLVIAFFQGASILISWLQSPSAVILEPKKIVWHCFHCFPIYLPWSDGTRCYYLIVFWMLSSKPTFSFSFFIKRLFSFSLLFALRVVSSARLRLLLFLMAILIPACASSSPVLCMMYFAYRLNEQGEIWLKTYWAWPCPSEQDPIFPTVSLPSGSFHKPLILIHQRADRMKTTITEN